MPGPARVVCISHEAGAGGEEVGRLVAERLGFTLVGRADILRALVVGSVGARAERLAAGGDREAGARAVKAEDAARADHLRRFYGVERELPSHYDLVVNTDALGVAGAAGAIAGAAVQPLGPSETVDYHPGG